MRKLSYGKPPQGERELAPDKKKIEDVVPLKEASEGLQELHPPAGYDPIATETQSPDLFIVISGGEKRERLYLEQLKRRGFRSLSIEFVAPQGKRSGRGGNQSTRTGTAPKDLEAYWQSHYRADTQEFFIKDHCYQLAAIDRIFFLTDLDDFRTELRGLLADPKVRPYQWVISNPCFEMWLYYSYFSDAPSVLLHQLLPLEEKQCAQSLKGLNHELRKGGIDPRKAFDCIEDAIQHARMHWSGLDAEGIPQLFSTQMLVLAEEIWSRIQSEVVERRASKFKSVLRGT